jgi:FtsP/CotA-like multicopper oxidase with cupredoxin domain
VSVATEVAGVRVVVESGQRVDVTIAVPADPTAPGANWLVGCHIPGHQAKGMQAAIRWVE